MVQFSSWLLFTEHGTRVEQLKRDVLHDIEDGGLPLVFDVEELRARMLSECASFDALDTLAQAERDWRATGLP